MLPEHLSHLGCFVDRRNTYLLFSCEGEFYCVIILLPFTVAMTVFFQHYHVVFFYQCNDTWCQRLILHIRWYDFVSNNEVLRQTGLLAASSIVRKRRLGLFGHVARLTEDVPANQILRTCCEAQDSARPSPD